MKAILMMALLLSTALVPACNRQKENAPVAPAPAAAPTATPAPEATTGTAQPPAALAPAPAAAPAASKPPAVKKSPPRTPRLAQPGAPAPAIPPPAASTATPLPAAPPKPQWREVTLPEGTALPLVLNAAVSSETAAVENVVSARLGDAVSAANGEVVLPQGTMVTGRVAEVERSGRVKGRAHLTLVFDRAQLKNGTLSIRTEEVRFEAESTTTDDAAKIGGGAVGGAIVGGILGGAKGAAKGAAIGGAAGTGVVIMTRGKEVNLPSGTAIGTTLAAPLTVTLPVR